MSYVIWSQAVCTRTMQSQWAEIVQAQITRVLDRVGGADRNRAHDMTVQCPRTTLALMATLHDCAGWFDPSELLCAYYIPRVHVCPLSSIRRLSPGGRQPRRWVVRHDPLTGPSIPEPPHPALLHPLRRP